MTTETYRTRLSRELAERTTGEQWTKLTKFALAIGFFALAAGIWIAYQTPASGFELSIYSGTPMAFWVAIVFALLVAVSLSFSPTAPQWMRTTAGALGVCVGIALVGLPLIRSYYFFGAGDSLTHLGWVKDMIAGRLDPLTFMYPASHLLSVFIGEGAGIPARRAVMLMVFAYALIPFLFVPLCMRMFTNRLWTVPVGIFCAVMLLPINNISVYLMSHPTTQAILFAPFVLYLLFRYLRQPVSDAPPWKRMTPWGVALGLTACAFVFVHPQQGVSLLLLFLTISAVLFLVNRYLPDHIGGTHNPLYAQTLLLGGLVAFWLPQHVRANDAFDAVITQLITGQAQPGDDIVHQSGSLLQVGGSIEELFVKLFLVTAIFLLLATSLVALSLRGWRSTDDNGAAFVQYIAAAAIPVGSLFLLYFLSGVTRQHYRQIGFIVMLVTILGGIAIVQGAGHLSERFSKRTVASGLGAALFVCLLVSIPALYTSPYIYQPTQDVSQAELQGYQYALSHAGDHRFVGVRGAPDRPIDALYGTVGKTMAPAPRVGEPVPPDVFNDAALESFYSEPRYLVVTEEDYEREWELWDGLRYTREGFDSLDTQPGVNLVYSNGEVSSYLVSDSSSETSNEQLAGSTNASDRAEIRTTPVFR